MAKSRKVAEPGTLLIQFIYSGRTYRMMVAKHHVAPGEADCVEVSSTDMLGKTSWTAVADPWRGSGPSADWLVRRALWKLFADPYGVCRSEDGTDDLAVIDLGDLT